MRLDDYYYLLHAFELLGRRLYGEDWTGDEFRAKALPSPDDAAAARAPLEARVAELDAEQQRLTASMGRTLVKADIDHHKTALAVVIQKRVGLHEQLFRLPVPDAIHRRVYDVWCRRTETERRLIDALRSGALQALLPSGMIVDWRAWEREKGFKLYLDLSAIAMPRHLSGLRRGSVLIGRQTFIEWLKTILPINEGELKALSAEEQCRAWLVALATSGDKRRAKPEVWAMAQSRFPGLSNRAFERLWQNHTPATWRRKGRFKQA